LYLTFLALEKQFCFIFLSFSRLAKAVAEISHLTVSFFFCLGWGGEPVEIAHHQQQELDSDAAASREAAAAAALQAEVERLTQQLRYIYPLHMNQKQQQKLRLVRIFSVIFSP
jgi:hypothetical protein